MGIDPSSLDAQLQRHKEDTEQAIEGAAIDQDHEEVEAAPHRALSPGQEVITTDGKQIGAVRSIGRGYFSVDVGPEDDYWLSNIYISSTEGGRVTLNFPSDEADAHRLRQPGLETLDRTLTGTGTLDQTRMDAVRIREQMEHEMLEQRGTMDTDVRSQ